jgi:hypothetical protein
MTSDHTPASASEHQDLVALADKLYFEKADAEIYKEGCYVVNGDDLAKFAAAISSPASQVDAGDLNARMFADIHNRHLGASPPIPKVEGVEPLRPNLGDTFEPTMDIYAKPGTIVRFRAGGGYEGEKKSALKAGFVMNSLYTVKRCDIGSSMTQVLFDEIEGRWNSCLFADVASPKGTSGSEPHPEDIEGNLNQSWLADAARWRMLPAFLEEHQIDYVKLLRDIDSAIAAQAEGGAE